MRERNRLLDEALSVGREELLFLQRGDVRKAEKLSKDRERFLDQAIDGLSGRRLGPLTAKLADLKSLQDEITVEAQRLQKSVKTNLTNMKKQTRRLAGYSKGSGNQPRLAKQRFLNKTG